jgi:2-desacetyl-2-hydroxyethyl bacteriochlorophyllide A dehydrogenase
MAGETAAVSRGAAARGSEDEPMRVARIAAPRRTELTTLEVPLPGAGEVRIAMEGCGICGSDLPVWEGRPWFDYPREPGAPGHEGWGRIDEIGPGVHGLTVGDRVAALGVHAYAEYDVVAAEQVVALPAALDGQPFPGEPLGCAANVFSRSGIGAGDTVTIVGVGFLGAAVLALAVAAGARVIAVARRATARELALELGAAMALSPEEDVVDAIESFTDGRLCDVVVEAAGVQATLELCGPLTRVRGRLVVAGFHQDGPRQVDMQLWNWRGLDVINAHERDPAIYVAGVRAAVEAVQDGRLPLQRLITHRLPLEQLDEAFSLAISRPEGFLKAVVER